MSDESVLSNRSLTGAEPRLVLPAALAVPPGAGAICDDAGARKIGRGAAEGVFLGPSSSQIAPAPGGTASAAGRTSQGSAPVRRLLEMTDSSDTSDR